MHLERGKLFAAHRSRTMLLAALLAALVGGCSTSLTQKPGMDAGLSSAVEGYLAAFLIEPAYGGQVYCASETLEVEQVGDAIKAWVWAVCEEFYVEEGVLQVGSGFSGPLMVYLLSNEQDYQPGARDRSYMATGYAKPGDGSEMADDINRIFPRSAIESMCMDDSSCMQARIDHLQAALEAKVHTQTPLPVATPSIH